jgi:hypothetical protein
MNWLLVIGIVLLIELAWLHHFLTRALWDISQKLSVLIEQRRTDGPEDPEDE